MSIALQTRGPCNTIVDYLRDNYAKNFFDTCRYVVGFAKLACPRSELLSSAYSSLGTVTDAYYAVDTMDRIKKIYDHQTGRTLLENVKIVAAELFHDACETVSCACETVSWLTGHKVVVVAAKALKWLVGFSCFASIYYNTAKIAKKVKEINPAMPLHKKRKIYAQIAMNIGFLVFSIFGLIKLAFAYTLAAPIAFALDTIILISDFYVFCRTEPASA